MSKNLRLPFINTTIVAGRLSADPRPVDLGPRKGAAFQVMAIRRAKGTERATLVDCAASGDVAVSVLAKCRKGSSVYLTGSIVRDDKV